LQYILTTFRAFDNLSGHAAVRPRRRTASRVLEIAGRAAEGTGPKWGLRPFPREQRGVTFGFRMARPLLVARLRDLCVLNLACFALKGFCGRAYRRYRGTTVRDRRYKGRRTAAGMSHLGDPDLLLASKAGQL